MYVFAYGSLLQRRSATRTLPSLRPEGCVPVRLGGRVRTFDVAFPNDGSQPDKAYFRADGSRPPTVLFANLRESAGTAAVNGVLVPVAAAELRRLSLRERRYHLIDLSDGLQPYPSWTLPRAPVVAFVGKPAFTQPDSAARGVVPAEYFDGMRQGADEWEVRCRGFAADFAASTVAPEAARIVPLRRIDAAG